MDTFTTANQLLFPDSNTPSPWFMRFSLVRFLFVRVFKTIPKYTLIWQSKSFICSQMSYMCIKDLF